MEIDWLRPSESYSSYVYHVRNDANKLFPGESYPIGYNKAPSLYGDELIDLCDRTRQNLKYIGEKIQKDRSYKDELDKMKNRNSPFDYEFRENGLSKGYISKDSWENNCGLCSKSDMHKYCAHKKIIRKKTSKVKQRVRYEAPLPRVVVKEEELVDDEEILYKIIVTTGDRKAASTTANVYLTLVGKTGATQKKLLKKKTSTLEFVFDRGIKETFFVKGPEIGNLTSIIVEHDGVEKKHSWFLESVEVINMASQRSQMFMCGRWLSCFPEIGKQKYKLKGVPKEEEMRDYEIKVSTGQLQFSTTDSKIYLTIYGKLGKSEKVRLQNDKRDTSTMFREGKADEFTIEAIDVGKISYIRIENDHSGNKSPDWFLEKVELTDIDEKLLFPCGKWLTKNVDEGSLIYDLYPVSKEVIEKAISDAKIKVSDKQSKVLHKVIVVTGDVRFGSTNANVYLQLIGDAGESEDIHLSSSKDPFERGKTDKFDIHAKDVGTIEKIRVRHDNTGLGAGWFLNTITIRKYLSHLETQKDMNDETTRSKEKPHDRSKKSKEKNQTRDKNQAHYSKHYNKEMNAKHSSKYRSDESSDDSEESSAESSEEYSEKKYNLRNSKRVSSKYQRSSPDIKTRSNEHMEEYEQSSERKKNSSKTKSNKGIPCYDEYEFVCNDWLADDESDGQIERLLRLKVSTRFYKL